MRLRTYAANHIWRHHCRLYCCGIWSEVMLTQDQKWDIIEMCYRDISRNRELGLSDWVESQPLFDIINELRKR